MTKVILVGRFKPSVAHALAGLTVTLLEAARAMDAMSDAFARATEASERIGVELRERFRVEAPRAIYAGTRGERVGRYAVIPDRVRREGRRDG